MTCSLLPLFVGRAALTQNKHRAIQAACLIIGSVIQLALFYYPMPDRGALLSPSIFVGIVVAKNLVLPLLGSDVGQTIASNMQALLTHGIRPVWGWLSFLVALVSLAGATILRSRQEPVWLLMAAGVIAATSYYAALGSHIGLVDVTASNRYAFVPNILIALALLSLVEESLDRVSLGSWVVIVWLLAIGAQDWIDPHMPLLISGPSWKDGLRNRHANSTAPIPIWPVGWDVKL